MATNFPYATPVGSASYRSRVDLEIVIPLSVSLVYRDTVLFEGLETGIEHEWNVPFKANLTSPNQKIEFETAEFDLPCYPGMVRHNFFTNLFHRKQNSLLVN